MSLSTQERRALRSIEGDLSGSGSKLVSMLATFTRLTRDEEMPGHERIATGGTSRDARRPQGGRYPRPGHVWRGRVPNHPPNLYRAGLLLWLVIAISLIAVALAVSRNGGPSTCMDPWLAACSAPAPTHLLRKPGGQPAALPEGQAPAGHTASGPGHG